MNFKLRTNILALLELLWFVPFTQSYCSPEKNCKKQIFFFDFFVYFDIFDSVVNTKTKNFRFYLTQMNGK